MIECQSCGAKNNDGREFCRVCGDVLPVKKVSNDTVNKVDVLEKLSTEFQDKVDNLRGVIEGNKKNLSEKIVDLEKNLQTTEQSIRMSFAEEDTAVKNAVDNLIEKKLYAMEKSTNTLIESRFDRLNQNSVASVQEEKENRQRDIDELKKKISDLQSELNEKTKKKRNFFGDNTRYEDSLNVSICSRWLAFLLCAFLGVLGMHRFYVGKKVSAIIYIFTFGALGIGVLVDLAIIAFGSFKDKDGLTLKL